MNRIWMSSFFPTCSGCGSVVAASDEFFAAKENLIKPTAPVFTPDAYGAKGQVYDGWETKIVARARRDTTGAHRPTW